MLALNGMLNHEQYQPENPYNTSWNRPYTLRLILHGRAGISGVVRHIVDCIGRGQVKSGLKRDGIHDPYIDVAGGGLMLS